MRLLKKLLFLAIALTTFSKINPIAHAYPTPVFNSLSPNLQEIMRLEGKKHLSKYSRCKTYEEFAEWELINEHLKFDGTLYEGHGGPMKLKNEDIESLYNLPNVKQLELEWFNLEEVDINKFLGVNNNKTTEMVLLNDCWFDTCDDEKVKARITNKEYTVGTSPGLWIAWPGVNPDDIFLGR